MLIAVLNLSKIDSNFLRQHPSDCTPHMMHMGDSILTTDYNIIVT